MVKHIYPLRPCPWCKKTPKFYMILGSGDKSEETWKPIIYCNNLECNIRPKSKHVCIRKSQKTDPIKIKERIDKLFGYWNDNNPILPTEGVELDFESISKMK